MAQFGYAFSSIRFKLFQSYCMSFYGSQLWDYSSPKVDKVYTAWRKTVRLIWRLPYRTHSSLLPEICEISPFERQMHIRFFNFMRNLCLSKNSLVSVCRKLVLDGSRSEVGRSFNYLVKKYHLERMRISEFDSFQMIQYQRWREQRRR